MEAQLTNWLTVFFAAVIAVETGVMVYANIMANKRTEEANERTEAANERMNWLTGAMERHSDQQRQIAATAQGIQLIWWDPTIKPWPFDGKHGESFDLRKIHIGIPTDHRQGEK